MSTIPNEKVFAECIKRKAVKDSPRKGFRQALGGVVIAVVIGLSTFCPTRVSALPFNQDMVGNQLGLGQVMRPKAEGSVSLNDVKRYIGGVRADAANLENPVPATLTSILHGKRLYNSNCSPCHGSFVQGKHVPGPVGAKLPAVNLAQDYLKAVPDSHFFQFIHFGGMAIMPAYGCKLSIEEHWDIVNYIRAVQSGADVVGTKRD
jgi:mono/diheme cytochrome c family protein